MLGRIRAAFSGLRNQNPTISSKKPVGATSRPVKFKRLKFDLKYYPDVDEYVKNGGSWVKLGGRNLQKGGIIKLSDAWNISYDVNIRGNTFPFKSKTVKVKGSVGNSFNQASYSIHIQLRDKGGAILFTSWIQASSGIQKNNDIDACRDIAFASLMSKIRAIELKYEEVFYEQLDLEILRHL